VSVDGVAAGTLSRGQFLELLLTNSSHITANRPILVAQYANGTQFDSVNADPFMALVTPVERFMTSYDIWTLRCSPLAPRHRAAAYWVRWIRHLSSMGCTTSGWRS
jgi:hypothetical protein